MASVTSLDKDLRKMRLDKYTPAAASEARSWIEGILGTRLPSGDLLEGLKDGVALCRLVNLALPAPGVKFKQSAMPFVQMENISQFLRACQLPPLNLQDHDVFLTVDLYESKDPAQVLQCLGAFSRAAHNANPSNFPSPIGPRAGNRTGVISPQATAAAPVSPGTAGPLRGRGVSNASATSSSIYDNRPALTPAKTGDSGSGPWSPTKSPTANGSTSPGTSTWSKREQEGATAPAWNIAQYGYLGGASQGNLGISFGARRQITSAGPKVPSLVEKERLRKEKAAEEERERQQMEEEKHRRRAELEAEEERARLEEERRWEEESRKAREEQKRQAEEEKRRWEEEERQWKLTEERRRREEEEAEAKLAEERHRARSKSDARLRGQFLSQYQAEQSISPQPASRDGGDYSKRIQELEKELEQARQREQEYERERQERSLKKPNPKARACSRSRPRQEVPVQVPSRQDSWSKDEREVLRTAWTQQQETIPEVSSPPLPARSPRPLPEPTFASSGAQVKSHQTGESPPKIQSPNTGSRPLPDPASYASSPHPPSSGPAKPQQATPTNTNRVDRFLASNPAPPPAVTQPTYSRELAATAEQDAEDRRRAQSQQQTKAGGWASKSLLEREMEMERQRQREWEEAQRETAKAVRQGDGSVDGVGGRWDVGQWAGYTGGDSQNKGSQGIGAGRRQIVGPRPLPGSGR